MQEIKLKSNLIKKSLGKESVTEEELEWLDILNISQNEKKDLSKEELENITYDLDNIFKKISFRFREVQLQNCSNEIYEIVMRESSVDDINVDGSMEHLFNLQKKDVKISNEFKKYMADESNELSVFKYCKIIKFIEVEPAVEISDLETITKYTKLENLIISIKSKEDYNIINKILEDKDIKIKLKIDIDVLSQIKEEIESNEKIARKIIEVDDISKFPVEDAKELADYEIYIRHTEDCIMQSKDVYSLEKYIEIIQKIDGYLDEINLEKSQTNIFLDIYQKLANNIIYENDELTGEPSERKEAHNIEGGLLEGKCVCEGYAKILQQVLNKVKINSKYITGNTDSKRDSEHAWNQVEIDGKWYNCDLTWDTPRIRENRPVDYCLQSDEEFINHYRNPWCENKCIESYDIKKIHKYMGFDTNLLESTENFPRDTLNFVYVIKEKFGTKIRLSLNENIVDDGYDLAIGKVLDNGENVSWLKNRIELIKEDIPEFIELFAKENMIKKKEEKFNIDWVETLNGIEIIIPHTLKKQLLEKDIDADQKLKPLEQNQIDEFIKNQQEKEQIRNTNFNDIKNEKNQTNLIEYKPNVLDIIKSKIKKYMSNFRTIFNNPVKHSKEQLIQNKEKDTKKKSWELDEEIKEQILEFSKELNDKSDYLKNNDEKDR